MHWIEVECGNLCSNANPSAFRLSTAMHLKNFSFETLASELQTTAPMLWSVLHNVATPSGKYVRKRADSEFHQSNACVIIAAAMLLKERCVHMSLVPYLIGLILWQGNASTKVHLSELIISYTKLIQHAYTYSLI